MKVITMHPVTYGAMVDIDVTFDHDLILLSRFSPLGRVMAMDWEPDEVARWVVDFDASIQDLRADD